MKGLTMIADELRKYASSLGTLVYASTANVKRALEEIADHIDSKCRDAYDFAGRIKDAADNREEITAFRVDYIPCPLDADGKPIHPTDWLVGPKGETRCVEAVCKSFFAAWCPERSQFEVYPAYEFSHKDTYRAVVEDAYNGRFDSFDALVERCKRLAGEDA